MSWLLSSEEFESTKDFEAYVRLCEEVVKSRQSKDKGSPQAIEALRKIEALHKHHYDKSLGLDLSQVLLPDPIGQSGNFVGEASSGLQPTSVSVAGVLQSENSPYQNIGVQGRRES